MEENKHIYNLQLTKRSNSGFKTIKVTDKACGYYKKKEVKDEKCIYDEI